MTEMITRDVIDNRILRATGQVDTDLGATMGAVFSQPMAGGLIADQWALIGAGGEAFSEEQRMQRRIDEEERRRENDALQRELLSVSDPKREEEIISRIKEIQNESDVQLDALTRDSVDAGRIETPDILKEKYGDLGLTFDRPMSAKEAELLAQGKREEIARNAIIAAGPQGVGPTIARFGAGLAATAVDPVELASMFIPAVGPARRAALTARFGKVGGRATTGAIEGLVGSALTEPLYYGLSRAQQLDYTMADALTNIGLGTVLGGGLGAGIGIVSRADAPRLDADLERAVGGTPSTNPIPRNLSGMPVSPKGVPIGSMNAYRAVTTDVVSADVALRQFVTDQSVEVTGVANDYRGIHSAPGRNADNASADRLDAIFPDDIYGPDAARYYGTGDGRMDRATLKVLRDVRGNPDAPITVYRAVPKDVKKINPGDWVTPNKKYAQDHGDGPLGGDFHLIEAEVKAGDIFTDANSIHEFGYDPEVTRASPKIISYLRAAQEHADLARKAQNAEFDPLANVDASQRADVPVRETLVADTTDDLGAMVAELEKAGALDETMMADLAEIKEIEARAKAYDDVSKAAVACLVGG